MQLGNYPIAMILRPFTSALFSLRLPMMLLTNLRLTVKNFHKLYNTARPAIMSDGPFRRITGKCFNLDFLRKTTIF